MTPDPYSDDSPDLRADEPLARPVRSDPPNRSRTTRWVAAAAVAGALLGTTGIAMAQTGDSSTGDPTASTEQAAPDGTAPEMDRSQAVHPGEELLTGDTAEQVTAAAQAAVPDATVDRVETDAEGSPYEAHMTRSDGTHVTVKVDESFTVTDVEDDPGPPAGAPGAATSGAPPADPSSTSSSTT